MERTIIQTTAEFSSETLKARRQKRKFCKTLNEKKGNKNKTQQVPKILYLATIILNQK